MKIILISVYRDIQALGLRILSARLKKDRHDVRLIFLPNQFNNNYDDKILNDVVSTKIMSLLTNQKMNQLGLNWLLLFLFMKWANLLRIHYSSYEGLKEIQNGDYFRINRYLKRRFKLNFDTLN